MEDHEPDPPRPRVSTLFGMASLQAVTPTAFRGRQILKLSVVNVEELR